jgi:hypothetical protein
MAKPQLPSVHESRRLRELSLVCRAELVVALALVCFGRAQMPDPDLDPSEVAQSGWSGVVDGGRRPQGGKGGSTHMRECKDGHSMAAMHVSQ